MTAVIELLQEYFVLKAEDRAIRLVRNEYMESHHCTNPNRDQEGDCIHQTVGMGGYPAPMCDVCKQRNDWYTRRQANSQRRGQIMRKLKRLVVP